MAGWVLVLFNLFFPARDTGLSVCLFKNTTGLPCPSCGTTHAVESILHARWLEAFQYNSIGYVVVLFLFVVPAWLLIDFAWRRYSLFNTYSKLERVLKTKPVWTILLVLLIVSNWIWNFYKQT
jgi:hypothetical protein